MVEPVWYMKSHSLGSINDIDTRNYIGELKYDGRRGQIVVQEDGSVNTFSSSLKDQNGKAPHIEDAAGYLNPGTILDGEWVMFKDGKRGWVDSENVVVPNFTYSAQVMGSKPERARRRQIELDCPITFVAFDLIARGVDDFVTHLPWHHRRSWLEGILRDLGHRYLIPSQILPVSQDSLDKLHELDAEGMMVKHKEGKYHIGKRTGDWLKLKFSDTHDVVIMGTTRGQGKYANAIGAIVFGQYRDGVLIERGQCSGMNDETRYAVATNPDDFIGTVMEVRAMGSVPGSDSFRHPQFVRFRDNEDKTAEMCEWE